MRSGLPKVLHRAAGRTLLGHALATAAEATSVAVVVGPGHDAVAGEALRLRPDAQIHLQAERRGTAHAVLAARASIEPGFDDVTVLFADTPLVTPETTAALRARIADGAAVAVLGFRTTNPAGYGRLLMDGGELVAIREHKDASEAERLVDLCNGGVMAIDGRVALPLIEAIGCDNAQDEFYLTDVVEIARARGLRCAVVEGAEAEVQGVNTRAQLAQVEATFQERLRDAAMTGGATLVAPGTVFFSHDTRLGRDVVVEPNVVFGPGVTVGHGAVIHAFSHLEGAEVAAGASVGPFARLRPGTRLGEGARVGNFVEIKNAAVEQGAKVNHLTYIGDARIGAGANVGAGTITCNYDGFSKHFTDIGAGAFIGSNSALVAPVKVGDGAYVGSGSVVTADVAPDALALSRARQMERAGWARAFRERNSKPDRT